MSTGDRLVFRMIEMQNTAAVTQQATLAAQQELLQEMRQEKRELRRDNQHTRDLVLNSQKQLMAAVAPVIFLASQMLVSCFS